MPKPRCELDKRIISKERSKRGKDARGRQLQMRPSDPAPEDAGEDRRENNENVILASGVLCVEDVPDGHKRPDSDDESGDKENTGSSRIDSANVSRRNYLAMNRYGVSIAASGSAAGLMLMTDRQPLGLSSAH